MATSTEIYPCPCTASPFVIYFRPWVRIVEDFGSGLPQLPPPQNASNGLHGLTPAPSTSANPDSDPPPTYDAATAPSSKTNLTRPPGLCSSRGAALPVKHPMPGVEYLSILDRSPPPITFEACGSCPMSLWTSTWRLSRHLICTLNNARPSRPLSLARRRVRYYDEACHAITLPFPFGPGGGPAALNLVAGQGKKRGG